MIVDNSALSEGANENLSAHSDQVSFIDLLQVLVDHIRTIVFVPVVIGLITLAATYFITPTFLASTKFLPPQQQQSAASNMLLSLGSLGGLAGAASALKNPADQYVAFLKTRVIQDALVERFALLDRYEQKFVQDARTVLASNTKITSKDNIITVDFEDSDPRFAAGVANGYVEELGRLLDKMAIGEAQQRRVFFEKQLVATKDSLIRAEQSLAASGIGVAALNSTPSIALEGTARLRAQVTALEIKLASMRTFLTPTSPEYRQTSAELAALKSQLARAEREQPAGSSGTNDYIAKYREYKYQETLFELFSRLYETAKVDESKQGVVQVVDPAVPPERKAKPKKALLAALATVGSGFALVLYFLFKAIWVRSASREASASKAARLKASLRKNMGFGRS